MNLMYRLANFMRGRRGWDQLGFFLMIASFVVEILGRILRNQWVYYAGLLLFAICIFRMLSRNIYKREAENRKYLDITNRFRNRRYFRQQKKNGARKLTRSRSIPIMRSNDLARVPLFLLRSCRSSLLFRQVQAY